MHTLKPKILFVVALIALAITGVRIARKEAMAGLPVVEVDAKSRRITSSATEETQASFQITNRGLGGHACGSLLRGSTEA
jgi:hypothetical protein